MYRAEPANSYLCREEISILWRGPRWEEEEELTREDVESPFFSLSGISCTFRCERVTVLGILRVRVCGGENHTESSNMAFEIVRDQIATITDQSELSPEHMPEKKEVDKSWSACGAFSTCALSVSHR